MASAVHEVLFYCCIVILYQLQILDTVAFIRVRSLFQSQVPEGYLFEYVRTLRTLVGADRVPPSQFVLMFEVLCVLLGHQGGGGGAYWHTYSW